MPVGTGVRAIKFVSISSFRLMIDKAEASGNKLEGPREKVILAEAAGALLVVMFCTVSSVIYPSLQMRQMVRLTIVR